jgi:DNA polymerase III gamma/tau subunit
MEITELPFVDKYRPKKICEIVGNGAIVQIMQGIAELGNMPNLLL